jgi:hypothetical protein
MSAVTPTADDELVQVFAAPAHGEQHQLMQLCNRDPLGNQESPPDRRAYARRLIRSWSTEVVSEESHNVGRL